MARAVADLRICILELKRKEVPKHLKCLVEVTKAGDDSLDQHSISYVVVYFQDEIGALVMDIGTTNTKCGFAGEDNPKAYFPTVNVSYYLCGIISLKPIVCRL